VKVRKGTGTFLSAMSDLLGTLKSILGFEWRGGTHKIFSLKVKNPQSILPHNLPMLTLLKKIKCLS